LRRTINRWVAPVDQKAPPGHCTGAAVDVYLVNGRNEPYDVTAPFSRFQSGPTYVLGLAPEALKNRMLLVETMLGVGFSNCRDEWWHYSYGDAGWAVRTGRKRCFYGLVELPEQLYAEQQRLWLIERRKRANPFKDEAARLPRAESPQASSTRPGGRRRGSRPARRP
jgi:D-alanyl-D-alanine dipeptidase